MLHLVASIRLVDRDGWCRAVCWLASACPSRCSELRPPVPEPFLRQPICLAIFPSIQFTTARPLVMRPPERLTLRPILLGHLDTDPFLLGKNRRGRQIAFVGAEQASSKWTLEASVPTENYVRQE